jgi:putative transcriptional regulator
MFAREFMVVFYETVFRLIVCLLTSPATLCTPMAFALIGLPCFIFGFVQGAAMFIMLLPVTILFLYINGVKISVLGEPGRYQVGLTSFGAPVDGLQKGMLLISIGAGGLFHRTVLYVIEHSDSSTLAVILNKPVRAEHSDANTQPFTLSVRNGGPLQQESFCIHDIDGVYAAERLLPGKSIFLQRNLAPLKSADKDGASVVILQGFAGWGSHQLEGEVRRGAWGWIKPEHVRPEDVLELDQTLVDKMWQRLVESPYLQIFEG